MNSNKRMKNTRLFSALAGLLIAAAMTVGAAAQQIEADWFVDGPTGDDNNSGTLWSAPFETLQKALDEADAALGPQIIFVAAGTYHPDEGPTQTPGDQGATYDMIEAVAVYGGFLNGDDFEDRDIVANETILSGEIGTPSDSDNSNNVVRFDQLSGSPAVLDGFTVREGFAASSELSGGGIFVQQTDHTIIRNCTLQDNLAALHGGGVGVSDNQADDVLEIRNCRFESNSAAEGGGIGYKFSQGEINVINCDFSANVGFTLGGGLYATGGNLTIVNTTFTENTSRRGGGAYFRTQADALFINALFASNTADFHAGAVYVTGGNTTAEFVNCTFSANDASIDGGGVLGQELSHVTITNCILWGNIDGSMGTDTEQAQLYLLSGATATVTYTCIEGCDVLCDDPNDNNIGDDPRFVDPFIGNYRLAADSPSIDVGNNDAVPCDEFDVDEDGSNCTNDPNGKTPDLDLGVRIVDGDEDLIADVDMGAYESVPCPADLDGDCKVGVKDLLILLGSWGPCPDPPVGCPADLVVDGAVGVKDLLFLLGNWGPCPCNPGAEVLSLEDKLAEACVTPENWDAFEAKMKDANASQEDKDNYYCWMDHYLFDCTCLTCMGALCPGPDPYIP